MAEGAIKTVISVLSHRAGVEDNDISWRQGVSSRIGNVAGLLEKPGDALGVMDIHLTPVGHDSIGRGLGVLQGVITDGDLRRHMGPDLLMRLTSEVMTKGSTSIRPGALVNEALRIMNTKFITALFVVENNCPVGIIHIHDCLRAGVA